MDYKVGQEVVVRKALGEKNGNNHGEYYHGGNLRRVPLGTKAVVDKIDNSDKIHLKFKEVKYGDFGNWWVHPEEVGLDGGTIQVEEREKQTDSLLEEVLTGAEVSQRLIEPQTKTIEVGTAFRSLGGRLYDKIRGIKRETKKITYQPFEPKFNAREEFALWLRKIFPDLPNNHNFIDRPHDEYGWDIKYPGKYIFPKEMKPELCKAAKLACEHGIDTTRSCVQEHFKSCLRKLEKEPDEAIFYLLNLIENVSANLPHERIHYGTSANSGASLT